MTNRNVVFSFRGAGRFASAKYFFPLAELHERGEGRSGSRETVEDASSSRTCILSISSLLKILSSTRYKCIFPRIVNAPLTFYTALCYVTLYVLDIEMRTFSLSRYLLYYREKLEVYSVSS